MSLRVPGGVYLMPPSGAPLSQSPGPPHNQNKPPAAVAIVTPQRSNSLDFLNFEEKRQLIASSLSLTDFLHHSGSATSPSSPTSGNVFIGELLYLHTCSNIHTACIVVRLMDIFNEGAPQAHEPRLGLRHLMA